MCPTSTLKETIELGKFYSLADEAILFQIHDAFEPELDRLKTAYAIQEPGTPTNSTDSVCEAESPSQLLYGEDHDEVNRTLVGVLALRWIMNNEYEKFVANQPEAVRLHRDSFNWLRKLFIKGLRTPSDLFALIMAMIINDLGKDLNLEDDYFTKTQKSVKGMNHDRILFEAA